MLTSMARPQVLSAYPLLDTSEPVDFEGKVRVQCVCGDWEFGGDGACVCGDWECGGQGACTPRGSRLQTALRHMPSTSFRVIIRVTVRVRHMPSTSLSHLPSMYTPTIEESSFALFV